MKHLTILTALLVTLQCTSQQANTPEDSLENNPPAAQTPLGEAGKLTLDFDFSDMSGTYGYRKYAVNIYDKNGTLVAGIWSDTGTVDSSGKISKTVLSADSNGCLTTSEALLSAGSYDSVFVIDTNNDWSTLAGSLVGCPSNSGHFVLKAEQGKASTVNIDGDTTATLDTAVLESTFFDTLSGDTGSGTSGNISCKVYHQKSTNNGTTKGIIGLVIGSANASSQFTISTSSLRLPPGNYRIRCYQDTDGNGEDSGDYLLDTTWSVDGVADSFAAEQWTLIP